MQRIQAMRALAALVATLSLVSGITLDCDDVVVDGRRYNLRSLGGPHSVHWIQETPPSLSNFTFTLDICKPLKRTKHVPKKDECPSGTRGRCLLILILLPLLLLSFRPVAVRPTDGD